MQNQVLRSRNNCPENHLVFLEKMTMRAALYARVSSTDKERDKAIRQTEENQLLKLRAYAKSQDWETVEYVDRVSGGKANRPAFKSLFESARRGEIDILLFWSLDRFSREGVLPTLLYLQELSKYGVRWKSFTQEYLNTLGPFGEAIIALMAALAQQEREITRERIIAGIERARLTGTKSGKPIGRPRKVV
ncbi:MAG: recombinase family protein [Nitrospira sp.]|nr:recombinase family protein [Nitrospira sp.]